MTVRTIDVGADAQRGASARRAERDAPIRTAEAADARREVGEARVGARDDVHDAADRIAAVQRGTCAAQDLDPLDHPDGHGEVERVVSALHVADANAVDEHDDLIVRRAAQPEIGLRGRARLCVYAEGNGKDVGQRARGAPLEVLTRDHLDGSGTRRELRVAARRDADGVEGMCGALLREGRMCDRRRAEERERRHGTKASHGGVRVGAMVRSLV